MTRAKTLAAVAVAWVVACGVTTGGAASPASAQRRVRVSLISDPAIEGAMREAIASTPEIDLVAPRRAELELRGTVAELSRAQVRDGMEVRARVTVVVADAHGGAVRAMLTGRAGARGGADVEQLSQNALRAAVRGALRSLSQHGRTLARR